MTLKRIVIIVVAIWLLLFAVGYVIFNLGGTTPGEGEGDQIGLSTP
jgi:hypothetical protein